MEYEVWRMALLPAHQLEYAMLIFTAVVQSANHYGSMRPESSRAKAEYRNLARSTHAIVHGAIGLCNLADPSLSLAV